MKIIVKTKNRKNIKLYLPTSIIKSKFFIKKFIDEDEVRKCKKLVKKSYKSLIYYVKLNGHFNLIEIKTHSTEIFIIV